MTALGRAEQAREAGSVDSPKGERESTAAGAEKRQETPK